MAAQGTSATAPAASTPAAPVNPWAQYTNSMGQFNTGQALTDMALNGYPQYQAAYNPTSMSMTTEMQQLSPQYTQGFNQYRDEALNKGPSAWLSMERANTALHGQDAKEHAMLENAGQTASARDNLASIGGLTSGARERVAEQGQKNYMSMAQDASRSGQMADLGAQVQDEGNRQDKLKGLTGMEETKMKDWEGARQTDISNTMQETARLNDYNKDMYKSRMEALAADRQAQATENSGKK